MEWKYFHLSRADCFTKFASDTSLFTTGISPEHMLSSETRTEWSLFERVINCDLRFHRCFARQPYSSKDFRHEKYFRWPVEDSGPGSSDCCIICCSVTRVHTHCSSGCVAHVLRGNSRNCPQHIKNADKLPELKTSGWIKIWWYEPVMMDLC